MGIKDWMELVNYRITEGSDYYNEIYGTNLFSLTYWNEDHSGFSTSIVFSVKTQEVFELTVCDYKNNRAYRFVNEKFKEAIQKSEFDKMAWDDVAWTDLEVYEDWERKSTAIVNGKDYDTRIEIPLDLEDHELMVLFKLAHEADMTFNEYVENIIRKYLDMKSV